MYLLIIIFVVLFDVSPKSMGEQNLSFFTVRLLKILEILQLLSKIINSIKKSK